jgi:hypothetical protein
MDQTGTYKSEKTKILEIKETLINSTSDIISSLMDRYDLTKGNINEKYKPKELLLFPLRALTGHLALIKPNSTEDVAATPTISTKKSIKKTVTEQQTWTTEIKFSLPNRNIKDYSSLTVKTHEMKEHVNTLKNRLTFLAEKLPDKKYPDELNKALLRKEGGIDTPLTIDELVLLFLQSDAQTLAERTYLAPSELLELQKTIPEFLEASAELQLREKALTLRASILKIDLDNHSLASQEKHQELAAALKELESSERASDLIRSFHESRLESKEKNLDELIKLCATQRQYQQLTKETIPHLVFEYSTGFLLRENQVKIISDMSLSTNAAGEPNHLCQQLVMGGGKTKVLLPMLALAKADGKTLSTIVVLEALYETNIHDLSETSFQLFGQRGEAFFWDRATPIDPKYLEERLMALHKVIEQRGYLIATPNTMSSIYLKYLELQAEQNKNPSINIHASIEGIGKILNLFREQSNAIIDEFDTVMATRKEVIFAGGAPQNLESKDIASVRALYEKMIVEGLVDIEGNKQHLLTEEQKQILDNTLKEHLKKSESSNVLKEEIKQLIPLTLAKNGGEHYGPSIEHPERLYCIPYAAAENPKENSEFGNPLETLNYSFQYYLSKGITKENAAEWLHKLMMRCQEESRNEAIADLSKTETGIKFGRIFKGIAIDSVRKGAISVDGKDEVTRFQEAVNSNRSAKLSFVEEEVAPKITYFPITFSSNAQVLASLFKVTQGVTGTPYNSETFPDAMKVNRDESLVNEMKDVVLKDVGEKPVKIIPDVVVQGGKTVSGRSIKTIFTTVNPDSNVRAIIDAGAFFEEKGNKEVAVELAAYFKGKIVNKGEEDNQIKGVLFFQGDKLTFMNLKGEVRTVKGSDPKEIEESTGCKPKNLFTYYDQTHTRGIDIKQKDNAGALLFVGHLTPDRDLWQAACRMRGIKGGQKIIPVMNEAEAKTISKGKENRDSVPTFNEVCAHSKELQDKENNEDNFRSSIQKIQAVFIQDAIPHLFKASSLEQKTIIAQLTDTQLLMQTLEEFATGADESEIDSMVIFEKVKNTIEAKYTPHRKDEVQKKLDFIFKNAQERIDKGLIAKTNKVKSLQSKEVQKQVEEERQMEKTTEKNKAFDVERKYEIDNSFREPGVPSRFDWSVVNTWEDLVERKINTVDQTLQRVLQKVKKPINIDINSPIFSSNLYISHLLDRPLQFEKETSTEVSPFSPHGKIPYYLLRTKDAAGQPKYVLISLDDEKQLREKNSPDFTIFSAISGKPLRPDKQLEEIAESDEFKLILTQARFLAGNLHELKKNDSFKHLARWFQAPGKEIRAVAFKWVLNEDSRTEANSSEKFRELLVK